MSGPERNTARAPAGATSGGNARRNGSRAGGDDGRRVTVWWFSRAMEGSGLSGRAREVLVGLFRYFGKERLAYPSIPTLARGIGRGERFVRKGLDELEKRGAIECPDGRAGGRYATTRWRLNMEALAGWEAKVADRETLTQKDRVSQEYDAGNPVRLDSVSPEAGTGNPVLPGAKPCPSAPETLSFRARNTGAEGQRNTTKKTTKKITKKTTKKTTKNTTTTASVNVAPETAPQGGDSPEGGGGKAVAARGREGESEQIADALRAAGVVSEAAIERITDAHPLDLVLAVIHRQQTSDDLKPGVIVWMLDPQREGAPTDPDLDLSNRLTEARATIADMPGEVRAKAEAAQARHAEGLGSLGFKTTEADRLLDLADRCTLVRERREQLSTITKSILANVQRESGIGGPIDELSADDLDRLLRACEPSLRRDRDQFLDLWHRQPEALRARVAGQLGCTVERVAEACGELHNAKHRLRAYRTLDAIDLSDRLAALTDAARDTIARAVDLDSGDSLLAACRDPGKGELRRRVRAAIDSHRQPTEAERENANGQTPPSTQSGAPAVPPPPVKRQAGGVA